MKNATRDLKKSLESVETYEQIEHKPSPLAEEGTEPFYKARQDDRPREDRTEKERSRGTEDTRR